MFDLEQIKSALEGRTHASAPFRPESSHASVAMITIPGAMGLEVCFILRAKREGDPWSGQVAFPVAEPRPAMQMPSQWPNEKTCEEVGLSLQPAHRVGALPVRPIDRQDVRGSMTLSPIYLSLARERKGISKAPRRR